MRFGFVTCVQLGKVCIEEIVNLGGRLDLLMTLRDELDADKSGRVRLDSLAAEAGAPLVKVRHVNDDDAVEALREADLDWLFVVGWSQIASKTVLDIPRKGVLGMHPTLLPVGRGRASIPWAILKDLPETGVTLFRLDEGVDTGPVLGQSVLNISPRETATTLYQRVQTAHQSLLRDVWPRLADGSIVEFVQDERLASVWPGRRPNDGELHPLKMGVLDIDRLVRAATRPYPGAFLRRTEGGVVRIWAGQPADKELPRETLRVQCIDGDYLATQYEVES